MRGEIVKAPAALQSLIGTASDLNRVDVTYDTIRLLGAVIGLMKLLQLATSATSDEKVVLAAARALTDLREDPDAIVERLRAAPFAEYTTEQLAWLAEQVGEGRTDLDALYEEAKLVEETDNAET